MAFLKDRLNAFLNQPIERKRSDHRLKSVDSCIDNRAWALDEEQRRQHFYNVVNRSGEGVGAEWEDEDSDDSIREENNGENTQINEEIKKLEDEKSVLKSVIADKENEIERLLFRIRAMAEVERSSSSDSILLKNKLSELIKQYNAKDEELKLTKDTLNQTENILTELQAIIESAGDDPEKLKPQLDEVMKDLQRGLQDKIDTLQAQVKILEDKLEATNNENNLLKKELELAQGQIEALASGDENDLNRIILALKNDINSIKSLKDAENNALKNIIDQKNNELKQLKDTLNLHEKEQSQSSDLDGLDSLGQREQEMDLLKKKLHFEKQQNKLLKDKITKEGLPMEEFINLNENIEDPNYTDIKTLELKKENESLKDANDKLNKKLASLKKELDEVQTSLTTKVPEYVESDKPVSQFEVENNLLKQRIKQLEDEILKFPGQIEKKIVPEVSEAEDEINKIKAENVKLLEENETLKRKNKPAEEGKYIPPKGDVEKETKVLRSSLSDSTQPLNHDQLQKENGYLRDQVQSLKNELKDLQKIHAPNDTKKEKLPTVSPYYDEQILDENNKLKKVIEDLNEKINGLEKQMGEEEPNKGKEEMVLENARLKKEVNDLKDKAKLIPQKSDLAMENQSLLSRVNDLTQSLNDARQEQLECNDENNKLLELLKKAEDAGGLSGDEMLNMYKSNADKIKTDNTKLQGRISELEKQLNNLREENKELKQIIDSSKPSPSVPRKDDSPPLKKEVHDLESSLQDLANDKLNKEIDHLQDENKKLKKEILDLKEKIVRLEKQQDDETSANEKCETLKKENKELNEKVKTLGGQLKANLEIIKTVPEEDQTLQTAKVPKIVKPEKLNAELEVENKKLKQRIKQLEDEIPRLPEDVATKIAPEVGSLEEEIKKLKAENARLSKENEMLQIKSKQVEEEKNLPPKGDLEQKNQEFWSKIKDLNKNLNDCQLQKEKDNLKIQTLENEVKNLEKLNSKNIKEEDPAIGAPYTDTKISDDNHKLRKEIQDLKEQINGFEKQLGKDKTDKGKEEIVNENDKLKEEVKNLKDKLKYKPPKSDLEKENQDLKSQISDLAQALNNVKKQKLNTDDENKRVLELLKKAEDAGGISGDEMMNMYKNNVDKLKKENGKLQGRISELEKQLNNSIEANKELQQISDTKKPSSSALTKDESSTLKKDVNDLEGKLHSLANDKLNKEIYNLQDENKKLKQEIKDLNDKINSLQKQQDKIVKPDKPNAELEVENNKLKQKIKQLEDENGKLQENVGKKMPPEVDALEEEIKELKAANVKLSKENEVLKGKSKQSDEEKYIPPKVDLGNKNQDLTSTVSDLTKSLKDCQLQNKNDYLKIQALEKELQNLEKQNLTNIKKESPAIVASSTDKKILDENDKLKQDIKELRKQINDLEKQLGKEKTDKEKEEIKNENDRLKEEVNQLKDKLKYTTPKGDLEKKTQDLMSKISELTQALNNAKKQNLEIDDENKRLLELLKKAEDAGGLSGDEMLNMYKNNADKLKKDNRKLQDKISDLEKQLNSLREENNELKQIIDTSKPQFGKEKTDKAIEDLINENDKLKTEVNNLKDKLKYTPPKSDLEKKPQELISKISDLTKALNDAKQQNLQINDENKRLLDLLKKAEDAGGLSGDEMLKMYKNNADKLKKDNGKLQDRISDLEKQLNNVKEANKKLQDIKKTSPKVSKKDDSSTTRYEQTVPKTEKKSAPVTLRKEKQSDQSQSRDKRIDRVMSPTTQPSAIEGQKEVPSIRKTLDKKENILNPDHGRKEIEKTDLSKQPRKKISTPEERGKADIPSKEVKKGTAKVNEYKVDKRIDLLLPPLGYVDDETKRTDFKPSKEQYTPDTKSKNAEIKQDEIKNHSLTKELDEMEVAAVGVGRRRSKSVDSALTKKDGLEMAIKKHVDNAHKHPTELDLTSQFQPRKTSIGQIKEAKITADEIKVVGDNEYDSELNKLKKQLYEAEKLIDLLKQENSNLKSENEELKRIKLLKEDEKEKYDDAKKYVDEDTNKLNRILQKAIRYGLKSLYLDELHFVHHALNNTMAERKGRPATPGRKSMDELERLSNLQDQRISSLIRRLDSYRQLSSEQSKRIMDYSQKVQRLNTTIGLHEMKSESLQYEAKFMRDLIISQKEKCKQLEEILKSTLDKCKCTGKWFLNQNYRNLQKK